MKKFVLSIPVFFFISTFVYSQPITRHALLVGIGTYPKESKWPKLHADQDAKRLKAEFKKNGFLETNIHLLTNQDADHQSITIELKKIYDDAEPEDQVILYFGGHSQQITDVSGDEVDHLDEAFVPYDAFPVYTPARYEGKEHLIDDEISKWVTRIAGKVTRLGSVFVLYDGGLSVGSKSTLPQKGVFPAFRIPSYFKTGNSEMRGAIDNEWMDIAYTEDLSNVISLDPGQLKSCSITEQKLNDGTFSSHLVSGFLKGVRSKSGLRYRELTAFLATTPPNSECKPKLDGGVQMEIFKSSKEKQFDPGKTEFLEVEGSQIYSITIGVSHYQNIDPLEYGHEDAHMFGSLLLGVFDKRINPENHFLFVDSNATIKPIIDAFESISNKVQEGDKIYFYFAGHGDVENLLSKKAHLLLYNSPSHVYKAGGTLPVEDVKDYLQQWIYKKARVFLVVDACKSGRLAGGLQGRSAAINSLHEMDNNSARLLSCHPNENSVEGSEFGGGHGAFTYYLVKGLSGPANKDGDEKITIEEISHFLTDSVSSATQMNQNPLVEGNKNLAFFPSITSLSNGNNPVLTANISQNSKGSNSSEDSLKARWMREIRLHCVSQNIVFPENNCAKSAFTRFVNTFPLDKRQIDNLKREIQNAIDRKSQSLINEYIKGNETFANEDLFAIAAKEMDYLIDMMDVGDQLYFMYISRKYFFEGRSIKPKLVNNDLQRFKLKGAIQNLERALKYEPGGAQNYNAIGRLRQVNREFESAIASYKKAIQLSPNWKFPINNLATVYDEYAHAKKQMSLEDSAVFYYKKALEIDPKFAVAHKNLGKAYLNQGHVNLAKKQYMTSIFMNPGYVESYQNLGDVYRQEQKWDSASYYLRQGLSIKPHHPDLLTNLGNVYFDQVYVALEKKDLLLDQAKMYYRLAFLSDSNCLESNVGLGNCYWETTKYDSAAIFYKKCVDLDSNVLDYSNYYIESLIRKGNTNLAEKLAGKMANLHPNNGQNWFDLGIIAVFQKNESLAETRFQRAMALGIKSKQVFEDEAILSEFRKTKRYKLLEKSMTP